MAIIQMEKLGNMRDLGGLAGKGGKRVRPGLLYRSEELQRGSAADLQALAGQYGIKAVIDLRCAAERRDAPDPEVAGAAGYWFPILKEETLGITHRKEADSVADFLALLRDPAFSPAGYMANLYAVIAKDPEAHRQYRLFLELLAKGRGPAIWHCTAGKDRAGIATVLLLAVLGVDRQAIMEDYLLTNQCTYAKTKAAAEALLPGQPELQERFCIVMQVQEDYLQAFFEAMDTAGGTEAFLKHKIGLTPETAAALQQIYLED